MLNVNLYKLWVLIKKLRHGKINIKKDKKLHK